MSNQSDGRYIGHTKAIVQFVDENGDVYPIRQANGKIRTSAVPYLHDVAKGNIANHELLRQLGYNGDVDNVREDMWELGGVYAFPTEPIQMQVVSSAAADAAAGTGTRTVEIMYLDTNYAEQKETVILNGVTPVSTVATNILRINNFHVLTSGSGMVSAGNISLQAVGGAVNYGYIAATGNQQLQAIYTVPDGKTLYLTSWDVGAGGGVGGKFVVFTLRVTVTPDGALTPGLFHFKDISIAQDGGNFHEFEEPIKCPGRSDIKISAISDTASSAVCGAHFEGWLE